MSDSLISNVIIYVNVAILGVIAFYGMHRCRLILIYFRTRNQKAEPGATFPELPRVTVQLPLYNEEHVAERIIDSTCAIDYPRHLLQIQVLDDSTDGSEILARQRVDYWQAQGVDIEFIHRTDRHGYKAGALEAGMATATGEYVAIFDADFVPPTDFLTDTIHFFTDEKVGLVQTRWEFINRNESLLTRAQAVFLDGHFLVEHVARHRGGHWFNFNGTAGIWRKKTIEDAGGWHHETLTEDVDLSFRAQMKGWQFIYTPDIACPSELPPEMNAFKAQQHRWAKGSIQCAKKLLLPVLKHKPNESNGHTKVSAGTKLEAFMHLTAPSIYPCVLFMSVLMYPAFYIHYQQVGAQTASASVEATAFLFGMMTFLLGTVSALVYYFICLKSRGESTLNILLQLPILMLTASGIALNCSAGVLSALIGKKSPFERTPKYNRGGNQFLAQPNTENAQVAQQTQAQVDKSSEKSSLSAMIPVPSVKSWTNIFEIVLGIYVMANAIAAVRLQYAWLGLPFLFLFATGYLYVGANGLKNQWQRWRLSQSPGPIQPPLSGDQTQTPKSVLVETASASYK